MCGILGSIIKDGRLIGVRLSEIYEGQKQRGQLGAGYAIGRAGHNFRVRFRSPKKALMFANRQTFKAGDRLLFHHRYPTSTPNFPAFNHPISNEDGSIMLIHNGHISNAPELFSKLGDTHQFETITGDDRGKRRVITDSEVIIHLLEDNLPPQAVSGAFEGVVDAFKATADGLEGTFAIAVMMGEVIYLFKKSNPIVVYSDPEGNLWFSSVFPIGKDYTQIAELEDGELGMLGKGGYLRLKVFEDLKPKPVKMFDYGDFNTGYHLRPAIELAPAKTGRGRCEICGEPTKGWHKFCDDCWVGNSNDKGLSKEDD